MVFVIDLRERKKGGGKSNFSKRKESKGDSPHRSHKGFSGKKGELDERLNQGNGNVGVKAGYRVNLEARRLRKERGGGSSIGDKETEISRKDSELQRGHGLTKQTNLPKVWYSQEQTGTRSERSTAKA